MLLARARNSRVVAVTPQTNTTLEEIAEVLLRAQTVAICGHVSPDGDCLGSGLALANALRGLGKQVTALTARPEPVEPGLRFLPGADALLAAADYDGIPDVFVAVDVPTPERLGDGDEVRKRAGVTVTIDHHAVPEAMADYSYTDPDAAATAMLVWQLARLMKADCEGAVATCCYTGLMTDTGRFQYQNSDEEVFLSAAQMVKAGARPGEISCEVYQNRTLASLLLEALVIDRMVFLDGGQCVISWLETADFERLGAQKSDAEPLVNALRSVGGVRVACMLRQQDGAVRGSLRAKDGTDVAAIARSFGGGGHKAAAGFTFQGTVAQAVEELSGILSSLE